MTNGTILLVEDNPLTRRFVRRALECQGCDVVEAESAACALGLAGEHHVDLVLQDLLLPDMHGFDLVQQLRALPACAETPILAFAGSLSSDDEARLSAAGFDGIINKPIEPDRLGHLVRGHLPVGAAARKRLEGKRLVVIDDDPLQLKLARRRLQKLGFLVETAVDGEAGLEAIRRLRPDAVVTDALMPRLDGFGLCLAVRGDPELKELPIVLCTASYVEVADRRLAEKAGANAFVTRSADFEDVIDALERLFSSSGQTPCPPAPETTGEVASARTIRALHQLERQVAINNGLVQRCSTLTAELSVLSTFADALVEAGDTQTALFQILTNCLDLVGASRGAIYVTGPDGALTPCASHGFSNEEPLLDVVTADRRVIERLEQVRAPVELKELIGAGCEAASEFSPMLVTPLIARGKLSGALVIETSPNASRDDWKVFAHAIGGQLSLALSLATAFAQVASSEQRARALMENAADAIFVSSESGTLLEVNHAGEMLLGLPADGILHRQFSEFVRDPPRPANDQRESSRRGESGRGLERSALRSDGTLVPIELSSTLVEAGSERLTIAIVRDVSERNLLAEQLRQAQKMEAIGRLAGGVAHDFNNMLSVVISFSELALRGLALDSPLRSDIAEIKKAGENASALTRQLLAFSRQEIVEPRLLVLGEIVSGMENMLRRLIGADIKLSMQLAADAGAIRADVGQLHQVILNLIVNARDAMPQGGKLSIEVTNVEVTPVMARRHAGAKAGAYVVLKVKDSGVGMDDATRARIFEPFFTTKDAGVGTGLGLATVFGIVRQSDGFIGVESHEGEGTTFEVFFPSVEGSTEQLKSGARPKTLEGSETVLLVEDDEQVRAAARSILQRHGYTVIEAVGAKEALEKCADPSSSIDLLLTDVVLPEISGPELVQRAKRLDPELKVLCMSGYSADRVKPYGGLDGVALLAKPITPSSLTRKVREVLDQGSSARPEVR